MAATIDRQAQAITVREYATRKRISLGTAYRRIWAGQVPAQQFLGRWLIRDVELDHKCQRMSPAEGVCKKTLGEATSAKGQVPLRTR
jgi:hypothetical protein